MEFTTINVCMPVELRAARVACVVRRGLVGVILFRFVWFCIPAKSYQSNPSVRLDSSFRNGKGATRTYLSVIPFTTQAAVLESGEYASCVQIPPGDSGLQFCEFV